VLQGTTNNSWVLDIVGTLIVDAVVQFLQLWPQVQSTTLTPDEPNHFSWMFSVRLDTSRLGASSVRAPLWLVLFRLGSVRLVGVASWKTRLGSGFVEAR
jgi:hypothetical protein